MKRRATSLVAAAVLVSVPLSALFACNAVLGIESDRKLDTDYPDGGYDGCSEGTGCSQCTTDLQRCLCEGGDTASCEGTEPKVDCESLDDDCMTCACEDCSQEYGNCTASIGCRRIRDCVGSHGCDLDSSSAYSCDSSDACGDVIDANGGPEGLPKKLFDRLADCAINADCPCKDRSCTAAFSCEGCGDCVSSCICGGTSESECQDLCACSQDDDCAGCADCMAECRCNGYTDSECEVTCTTVSPCSADNGCKNCSTCAEECRCAGGTVTACARQCGRS